MLYPILDSEEWANKYNLKIEKSICLNCNLEVVLDVAVASKKFRGFKSREHGCPKKYNQYNLVLANNLDQQKLKSFTSSRDFKASGASDS